MKSLLKGILKQFGWEIRRSAPPVAPAPPPRCSFRGCLTQAQQNGLNPKTVIDVGVATGTPELYETFPQAFHLLIEPLIENQSYLEAWKAKLAHCDYILGAAAQNSGHLKINVHPDLVGSSLYKEAEGEAVDGVEREISTITLDEASQQFHCSGPYLIKIVLEVSFFEFFKGAPTAWDYFQFMSDRGFVIYDIFDISYRLLDRAMSQANVAFVPAQSIYRQNHVYATPEQRAEQNQRLLAQEYQFPL